MTTTTVLGCWYIRLGEITDDHSFRFGVLQLRRQLMDRYHVAPMLFNCLRPVRRKPGRVCDIEKQSVGWIATRSRHCWEYTEKRRIPTTGKLARCMCAHAGACVCMCVSARLCTLYLLLYELFIVSLPGYLPNINNQLHISKYFCHDKQLDILPSFLCWWWAWHRLGSVVFVVVVVVVE